MATHVSNVPVYRPPEEGFRGVPMPESQDIDSIWEAVEALKEIVEVLVGDRGSEGMQAVLKRDLPTYEEDTNKDFRGLDVDNGPGVGLGILPAADLTLVFPNVVTDTAKSWQDDEPNGYTVAFTGYYFLNSVIAVTNLAMGGGSQDFDVRLSMHADASEGLADTERMGSRELDSIFDHIVMELSGIVFLTKGQVITIHYTHTGSSELTMDRVASFLRLAWLGKLPETGLPELGINSTPTNAPPAFSNGFSSGYAI